MKRLHKRVALMLAITTLMLTGTAGAANVQKVTAVNGEEIVISAEVLCNSKIEKKSDSLITITSESTTILPQTRASSTEPLYATDVETIALLVSDSSKTDEVYQGLLDAGDEASSYKSEGSAVVGMTIYTTVYYTIHEMDGNKYYHFEAVEGGNTKPNPGSNVIGSGFVIASQSVTYGVQGANLEGVSASGERETVDLNNTDDYFYIEVDDNWPTIGTFFGVLGAYYSVDVASRRDGSHTLMELSNNPLESIVFPGW